MLRRRAATLAAGLLAAVLLAGCGGGDSPSAVPSSPGTTTRSAPGATIDYVALGDSYTAAPGLPPPDGDDGCMRSADNYPHLVAKQDPAIELDDVSCTGATTDDVIGTQADALSADTDLVTVGIGGNDESLFVTVLGGCAEVAASDPTGDPCTRLGRARATAALRTIRGNIDRVLDEIAHRAPNARVLAIGYPQVLPGDGSSCPDLVPIATGDYAFVNSVNAGLSRDLKDSAAAHGADYVDVFAASAGHDVCSDHPWVNGQTTAADGVIPFHPFGAEQRAVAALVTELL